MSSCLAVPGRQSTKYSPISDCGRDSQKVSLRSEPNPFLSILKPISGVYSGPAATDQQLGGMTMAAEQSIVFARHRYSTHLLLAHLANDVNNAIIRTCCVNITRHYFISARDRAVFVSSNCSNHDIPVCN